MSDMAEWVRTADYYNRYRPIGSPGWGELETDVKKKWREEYRRDRNGTPEQLARLRTLSDQLDEIGVDPDIHAMASAMDEEFVGADKGTMMRDAVTRWATDTEHEAFAGGGMRQPQGDRPRFELLWPKGVPFDQQILTRFARHMARGAIKYEDRNWENFSDQAALDHAESSLLRHVFQWLAGAEDEDHASAILFNVMCAEHVKSKLSERKCAPEDRIPRDD